ncbi:iron-sulfur cluster biosynthesis protein [Staphylococcus aureus]|uniref:HesB/YadR/YfhF family protein n=1 Tax=Staphylococcus aureus TaxID=1280 RepID=UPI0015777DDD|nr:iron-sulfur cluster biosynthesis protein [Staphylococcus aureus]CAC8692197.1 iron-sulfur cluster biosynthesis protein [Staphylococcus aureus]CAC9320329.1 iron-sulfur cluster biosynthesis protein [Staphylococcus aureus]HEE1508112.1 HesB/YadR/YfhF family protein [Staphylococcus aureus]
MQIELTDAAVTWFKNELELPENNKVLVFFVRYGGEFQLKQGFSPAFTVEPKEDVVGYEQQYDDLNVVVAEKDLWYFEDDHIIVNVVDHEDEISYSTK